MLPVDLSFWSFRHPVKSTHGFRCWSQHASVIRLTLIRNISTLNNFDLYEEDEMLIAREDIVDNQLDLRADQEEILTLAQDEPARWPRLCRVLLTSLWQLRPRWNIEAMYPRDPRELTEAHLFKPTSLSRRLIADIWMLNSKH
jgi:hypothetical protein